MANHFQVKSLMQDEFFEMFQMDNSALEKIGALRMVADKLGKYPCRISLADVDVGEDVILLNYQHHKTSSPYRATGPLFVKLNGIAPELAINEIPKFLDHRFLSLRAYDKDGLMNEAVTTEGKDLMQALSKLLDNQATRYIHIHNARQGCYLCAAERV
jgi:hypothetical protein